MPVLYIQRNRDKRLTEAHGVFWRKIPCSPKTSNQVLCENRGKSPVPNVCAEMKTASKSQDAFPWCFWNHPCGRPKQRISATTSIRKHLRRQSLETRDPGRDPANPSDADAQGKRCPDPEINSEAKTNRTHSSTGSKVSPGRLHENQAGRLSRNHPTEKTRHDRQHRTGKLSGRALFPT